ncbi:MAG TPA: oligosaccharide flippase family protein [Natronosporangium sp.]|nr:oligosaccharide flippase family protein [Natronosporangium sp.]
MAVPPPSPPQDPPPPPAAEVVDDRPHDGRTVRGAVLWSYLLGGGQMVLHGGVTLLLAAILLPEVFGVMALALTWVTFAQMLLHEGPALAVIQRADVNDRHLTAAFVVNLITAALIATVFVAVAPLWAAAVKLPELTWLCWALAPVILLHALIVVPDAILRRQMRMRRLQARLLTATAVSSAVAVGAALAGLGVWALVLQHLTAAVLSAVLLWASSPWRPRRGPIRPALRDLRRFSVLSISDFLAGFISSRADAILAGLFFHPLALGLYRFSLRIVEMGSELAFDGIRQVTVPHLSRLQDQRAEFEDQLGKLVHAGAVLAVPALGILAGAALPLLTLLGEEWIAGTNTLRLLCLFGVVACVSNLLGPAIQAAGRPGIAAAIGWISAGVAAALLITVGLWYGGAATTDQALAMAAAMLGAQLVTALLTLCWAIRGVLRLRLGPILGPAAPALLAAVAAAASGIAAGRLGADQFPALAGLLVTGTAGALAAGAVLFGLDARFVARVRQLLNRSSSPTNGQPAT